MCGFESNLFIYARPTRTFYCGQICQQCHQHNACSMLMKTSQFPELGVSFPDLLLLTNNLIHNSGIRHPPNNNTPMFEFHFFNFIILCTKSLKLKYTGRHRGMLADELIRVGSISYEKVKNFKYLGSLLTNQNCIHFFFFHSQFWVQFPFCNYMNWSF